MKCKIIINIKGSSGNYLNFWRIVPGRKEVRSTTLGKFIHEDYIAIGWNPVRDLTDISEDDLETVCRRDLQGWDEDPNSCCYKSL